LGLLPKMKGQQGSRCNCGAN